MCGQSERDKQHYRGERNQGDRQAISDSLVTIIGDLYFSAYCTGSFAQVKTLTPQNQHELTYA